MKAVRKASEILLGAVIVVGWLLALRALFTGHWIQALLVALILISPTIALVRAIVVAKADSRPVNDELADSFTPINTQPASPAVEGEPLYCLECGTQNQAGDQFCRSCGKSLK